jgi:hypothetical protein
MRLSGFQFTIQQMMIAAALVGLILAFVEWAMREADWAFTSLGIIWLTAPMWGWFGLALLSPSVTRGLFLASCVVVLPVAGYTFFRFATAPHLDLGDNEWLLWSLAFLWLILPFAVGHAVSKRFHAWRARNQRRRHSESDSMPGHVR